MKGNSAIPFIVLQLLVLVTCALIIGGVGRPGGIALPKEAFFALVLVFGVVFLMTTLFIISAGFAQLGLKDDQEALGLPRGSVRAMIALILILIFIMFGVYLYLNESTYWVRTGDIEMAQDAWESMPNVYSAVLIDGSDPPRYNVVLIKPSNEGSSDLAQQLLTTVGTLVVAVAGFYFGSATTASDVIRKYAGVNNEKADDAADEQSADIDGEPGPPTRDE